MRDKDWYSLMIIAAITMGILLGLIFCGVARADVIACKATGSNGLVSYNGEVVGYGTFFCVGADEEGSYCMTCKHVVEMEEQVGQWLDSDQVELLGLIYRDGDYYEYPLRVVDVHPTQDMALVKILGVRMTPLELVDDREISSQASLYLETDIFEVCEKVEGFGKMISGRCDWDGVPVRLINIDVVGGYSGTAVRLAFAREKVVGMIFAEHKQNGVTLMVPSGEILEWLKEGE